MAYIWVTVPGAARPYEILDAREYERVVFTFVEGDREFMFEVLERLNHPDLLDDDGDPDELAILYCE